MMATFPEQFPSGEAQLAAILMRLQREVEALKNMGARVPVLDEDPPEGSATNIWLFDDGRLNIRGADGEVHRYHEHPQVPARTSSPSVASGIRMWLRSDLGNGLRIRDGDDTVRIFQPETQGNSGTTPTPGGTTTKPKPPPQPTPVTRTRTWTASWSQTYNKNGSSQRSPSSRLWYGSAAGVGDSFNGFQMVMIGLPDSDIRSVLSGARIRRVEVFLHNEHSYWNKGVEINIGAHNRANKPSSYSGIVRQRVSKGTWGKPQSKWQRISDNFGIWLRDNRIKGLVIHQPSSSLAYYGYASGVGARRPPRIRITYTK